MIDKTLILIILASFTVTSCIGQKKKSENGAKTTVGLTTISKTIDYTTYYDSDSINYDSLGVISFDSAYTVAMDNHKQFLNYLATATLFIEDTLTNPIWVLSSWKEIKLSSKGVKTWIVRINATNGEVLGLKTTKY